MASESLPYIDTHYSVPAVKEHVDALIAAEMGRVQSARTHPALSAYPDVPIFSHNPYLARRLDRVSQKGEAEEDEEEEGVDMAAYALPAMDTNGSAIIGADEWHAAVHRAVTLLEHQRTRVENLELMAVYGANQWLYHLHQTDARVQQLEATRDTLAAQVEVLNATRKDEQLSVGDQLQREQLKLLNVRSNNVHALLAIAQLEQELARRRGEHHDASHDDAMETSE